MIVKLFELLLTVVLVHTVQGQSNCPDGWQLYNNFCWYFSYQQPAVSWTTAESWCQQNNGHLASFATTDERDWVVDQNLEQWDETRWWIGLNDVKQEGKFVWSDGTPYDTDVANWKLYEPNNAYMENCVEVWLHDPIINDKQWNDNSCEWLRPYVCKSTTGTFSSCPSNYVNIDDRCYYVSTTAYQWQEAQADCKKQGANLVSIGTSTEQASVQNLINSLSFNYWSGLSDTASPDSLSWSDSTTPYTYTNWAPGQPPNPLPYHGSTCTEVSQVLGWRWNVVKCSEERRFICERGLKAQCPPGWLYFAGSGKCYEFVVNSNRKASWTTSKQICSDLGGGMLRILGTDEEEFIGSIMESYTSSGHPLVWLGASDIGHDDQLTWWDQTSVDTPFWNSHMPQYASGRDDCVALYTGKRTNNWETATCFEERAYICELPEGQGLPTFPVVTVEGRCDEGWRHLKGYCYLFGSMEKSQQDAESYCVTNNAHLTSITSEKELSFIVGNLQQTSWMGLVRQGGSLVWKDGTSDTSFDNWRTGEPNNDGDCVTVDQIGEWADGVCGRMWSFICKKDEIPTQTVTIPPPTNVPDLEKCGGDNWISDPSSDRCYKVNFDPRSWSDARYACQVGGGDLASINTPDENAYVFSLIRNIPNEVYFFIGGSDQNNYNVEILENGWSWSDGSPFNYINWAPGEPNSFDSGEDCIEMYGTNGYWNDNYCTRFQPSVCEKVGNVQNIVGPDVTDDNCNSNDACCFRHLGAEYGGTLPDSAMSSSTDRDQWFTADRGRLNTPSDVIIIDVENEISFGNGHGAWSPSFSDPNMWLQVDLADRSEVKGIITQGRNGIIQYSERQWVTSFKVSYSQDADNGKWEFVSDENGDPITFPANSDQNTQVTNLFPRPILAMHMRCHPITWFDAPCMRLEYIGCKTSCVNKLGMNSGLIGDKQITASSSKNGREPKQARPAADTDECLADGADNGANYRGWISKTTSGKTCQAWSSQSPHTHGFTSDKYPTSDLRNNYCRNPNGRSAPWCYTTDPDVEWESCYVPTCPAYVGAGWSPTTASSAQYIQVMFMEYFKVSGVTMYGGTSSFVTSYQVGFSDDGGSYKVYQDQSGSNHMFTGLTSGQSEYTDILREPVSTRYVRIYPQTWKSEPLMRFELLGCYVDNRVTCSDTGTIWRDSVDTVAVDCPSGCVEDVGSGVVWGTDVYTLNSAVCPAAVHAGKVLNTHGGSVYLQAMEGQQSYLGTSRNGITSQSFGPYSSSFVFSGKSLRCSDGWFAWKDHCYYLSPKGVMKTWHDARSSCLNMGGDLVSIWSEGENSFVESKVYVADLGGDVWIGLNDLDTVNYYLWSDGSPVTMTKWYWDEPKSTSHQCVNMYRFEAYWNDKKCDTTLPYMCKSEKQLLPPLVTEQPPVDVGCDPGWTAYGSSCYQASTDEYMFIYANRHCEEKGGKLPSIHDDFEQAFVFSLILNTIPPGLGYTSWIGLSAKTTETGSLYYTWESNEFVTYTHWDKGEPEVRFSCSFPFEYQGVTYYECTTYNHPARVEDTPWCSIDPVYRGRWINCGTGDEFGCTYMDDQTGFWQIDICGQNRYYVCEKDRVGYTPPATTTIDPGTSCARGWYGDDHTTACYQINEFLEQSGRASWQQALEHCRSQNSDLVSIHSLEEGEEVSKFVSTAGVYSGVLFWTGLNSLDVDSGYEWTDGTPVSYTSWNVGEPNNHNGLENCVESQFSYSSIWNDLNCDAVRNWICKISKNKLPRPPATLPPPGGQPSTECGMDGDWIRFQTSYGLDKCYLFVDDIPLGWLFAENNCTARGGHLVAIHSADENTFLLSRASKTTSGNMWIGLRDMGGNEGTSFRWSDNSTLDYINWSPGEPNGYLGQEDCAELSTSGGLWNDNNCGKTTGYICEKYLGADSVVIPPTQPASGGCPSGFRSYGNRCWYFGGINQDDKITWYDMLNVCAGLSAEAVSILNSYEQAYVSSMLPFLGGSLWLGMSGGNALSYVWNDQSEITYTNWKNGEPNGYYGDDACVEMLSGSNNGKWGDTNCYSTKAFACTTRRQSSFPDPTKPTSDSCSDGFTPWGDGLCYSLYDQPSTRGAAADSCKAQGNSFIISIGDAYENNLYKSLFWRDVQTANTLWIGLTFTSETLDSGEVSTLFKWDDGWPVGYTNWGKNEPSSAALAEGAGCAKMNNDGTWAALPQSDCTTSSSAYICKQNLLTIPTTPDPGVGNCDPGFFSYGTNCYYIETAQYTSNYRSWHEASYECESRGASLASFHSIDECEAVVSSITGGSHNLFIGLVSDGYTGWKWSDGSGADFFNWVPGEPNGQMNGEECVEMYPWDGTWNDVDCLQERGYVCKKSKDFSKCGQVMPVDREECGYELIEESSCLRRGCCWDPTYVNANFSGCYFPYGANEPITGTPPSNPSSGGISAGAVVGIIAGVLAVVVIAVGGVWYMRSGKSKEIGLPSLPTWKATSSPSQSKGFENPVTTMQDEVDIPDSQI